MEYNLFAAKVVIKGKATSHEILELPDKFLIRKGGFIKGVEQKRSWKLILDTINVQNNSIKYKNLVFILTGTYEHPYLSMHDRNFENNNDFKSGASNKSCLEGIPAKDIHRFGRKWEGIKQRCGTFKAYLDVTISEKFSEKERFVEWCHYERNSSVKDKLGTYYELDKDIVNPTVRQYSEENCVFVPREVNQFFRSVQQILVNKYAGICSMSVILKSGEPYYKIAVKQRGSLRKLMHSADKDMLAEAYRQEYDIMAKELSEELRELDQRVLDVLLDLPSYIDKYKTW